MNDLTTTLFAASAGEADDLAPTALVRSIKAKFAEAADYSDATLLEFALTVRELARVTLLRASVVAGQVMHETRWLRYGGDVTAGQFNFAGIGATGGVAGNGFPSLRAGLEAVFAHHLAYALGLTARWPSALRWLAGSDPRYIAVATGPHAGKVKRIGDYTNGRWAFTKAIAVGSLDNGYARGIVKASNELLAATPVGAAGVVAKPKIITTYPEDGQGDTGQAIVTSKHGDGFAPVMVSSHITAPPAPNLSDHGSLRYLVKSSAQASVHFLIGRAGGIFSGGVPLNRSPWTNGVNWATGPGPASNPWRSDLSNPYIAAAVKARDWFNTLTFTIEHEGYTGDKLTNAQWAATKQLQAWLCANGRKAAGLSGVIVPKAQLTLVGHFQFDGVNRPNCPGWTPAQWAALEADVKAILATGVGMPSFGEAWAAGGGFGERWSRLWG